MPLFVNMRSKPLARSRREPKGSNTIGYQTVNPFDNQVVASFEDLTDEHAITEATRPIKSDGTNIASPNEEPKCVRPI